eukprot:jgi/Botrbrau1/20686/Bobra.0058s0016.1
MRNRDAVSAFPEWLDKVGIIAPNCCIAYGPAGRGVHACGHIAEGKVVVEVPDDLVLLPETSCIGKVLRREGLVNAARNQEREVLGLILAVMAEKALGPKSGWAPYLEFLPADVPGMPMYWGDQEMRLLEGTSVLDRLVGRVRFVEGGPVEPPTRVEHHWREVVQPFLIRHPRCGVPPDQLGWQLYRWATAVVAAYSFSLGDDQLQGMVPYWDLLNHVTGKANVRLHHHARRGTLQMIATRAICPGEEVINSYGDLSNGELLRRFGFTEADPNPHASVDLPVQALVHVAALRSNPSGFPDKATGQDAVDCVSPHRPLGRKCLAAGAGPAPQKGAVSMTTGGIEPSTTSLAAHLGEGTVDAPQNSEGAISIDEEGKWAEDRCGFLLQYGMLGGPELRSRKMRRTKAEGGNSRRDASSEARGTRMQDLDSSTAEMPNSRATNQRRDGMTETHRGDKLVANCVGLKPAMEGMVEPMAGLGLGLGREGTDPMGTARFAAYRIPSCGTPPSWLVEAARLLALPQGGFMRFRREVLRWRVPRAKPLSGFPQRQARQARVPGTHGVTTSACDTSWGTAAMGSTGKPKTSRGSMSQACTRPIASPVPGDPSSGSPGASTSGRADAACSTGAETQDVVGTDDPTDCGAAGCRGLLLEAADYMLGRYPGYRECTAEERTAAATEPEVATKMGSVPGSNGGAEADIESCVPSVDAIRHVLGRKGKRKRDRRYTRQMGDAVADGQERLAERGNGPEIGLSQNGKKKLSAGSRGRGDLNPALQRREGMPSPLAHHAATVISDEISAWKALKQWVGSRTDQEILLVSREFWQLAL